MRRKFAPAPPCFRPQATVNRLELRFRGTNRRRRTMKSGIALRSLAFALATFPLSAGLAAAVAKPTVEVAFVLDTTGSMGGLIEGAKRKIWSIATAIVDSNPDADIRMGLVAYRDIGDDYVTQTFYLTTDIPDLYARQLELKAAGAGAS